MVDFPTNSLNSCYFAVEVTRIRDFHDKKMLPALPVHHPRPLIKGWGNGETLLFSMRPEPLQRLRPV